MISDSVVGVNVIWNVKWKKRRKRTMTMTMSEDGEVEVNEVGNWC